MITIRFKVLSIIIALVGAFFLVNYASAQTSYDYSRSPSGSGYYNSVSINIQNFDFLQNCNAGHDIWIPIAIYSDDTPQEPHVVGDSGKSPLDTNATFDVIFDGVNTESIKSIIVVCLSSTSVVPFSVIILEYNNETPLFFLGTEILSGSIWGTEAGFWGDDFSTPVLKDTLTASVQDTGANLWALLVFAGIALAFIIFLQVVVLTKKSVKPTNKKEFDEVAFNKKADELEEFYSRTGGADPELVEQIKKRGRGRPRKNPIE